jgi:hypothetical protein
MTAVFTGADGVQTYRAITLKHALRLYAKAGIKPNRMWTPTNMLKAAGIITGRTYRRGQYELAITELDAWLALHGTNGR